MIDRDFQPTFRCFPSQTVDDVVIPIIQVRNCSSGKLHNLCEVVEKTEVSGLTDDHKPVHLVSSRIIEHSVEPLASLGCNFHFLILSSGFFIVHAQSVAAFTEKSGNTIGMAGEQMKWSKGRDTVAPEPALPSACIT